MSIARLEGRLGHRFADPALIERALTHRSAGPRHYERLEFLGDGVLNFVITEALFQRCPATDEGGLTRLRASLVREETLAQVAEELGLSAILVLGPGELRSGAFRRRSILADAVEALLGAVLVDAGFEAAREVCLRLWAQRLDNLPDPQVLKDAKTQLQEVLQRDGRPRPQYDVLETEGPQHRQLFRVRCLLTDSGQTTEASGGSRRVAEQRAAGDMLALIEQGEGPDA